jgi:hypothetical protein
MLRQRFHKFHNDNDNDNKKLIDEYYYNQNVLDFGYRRIKKLDIKNFLNHDQIQILYLDNNSLSSLPSASLLPNLTYLSVSNNKLTSIPFYHKLTFINFSKNNISALDNHYCSETSVLKYIDASYNLNYNVNVRIPNCTELYATHCSIDHIYLDNYPKLKVLDIEHNNIRKIRGHNNILEINISNNQVNNIDGFNELLIINACNNKITNYNCSKKLISANLNNNLLTELRDFPKLRHLEVSNNKLSSINNINNLEYIDVCNNNLSQFNVNKCTKFVCCYGNPITMFGFSNNDISNVTELSVDYNCYNYIMSNFKDLDQQYIMCRVVDKNILKKNIIKYSSAMSKLITDEKIDCLYMSLKSNSNLTPTEIKMIVINVIIINNGINDDSIYDNSSFKNACAIVTKLYKKSLIYIFHSK